MKSRQVEPDPVFLDDIGMTREEYLQKDLELRAEAEKEDEEVGIVVKEEEEPEENLTLLLGSRWTRDGWGVGFVLNPPDSPVRTINP